MALGRCISVPSADGQYILKHSLDTVIRGLKVKGLHTEVNEQYREYAKYHLNVSSLCPTLYTLWFSISLPKVRLLMPSSFYART